MVLKFGGTLNLDIKKIQKKYKINNSAFKYLQYPKLNQLKISKYFCYLNGIVIITSSLPKR